MTKQSTHKVMPFAQIHDDSKFCAIVGLNGFGVFTDMDKIYIGISYLVKHLVFEYENFWDAYNCASRIFVQMNHYDKCFPKERMQINWMYYKKDLILINEGEVING